MGLLATRSHAPSSFLHVQLETESITTVVGSDKERSVFRYACTRDYSREDESEELDEEDTCEDVDNTETEGNAENTEVEGNVQNTEVEENVENAETIIAPQPKLSLRFEEVCHPLRFPF